MKKPNLVEEKRASRAGSTDGQLHRAGAEDLRAGAVLRMQNRDGTCDPFSDMVVLQVVPAVADDEVAELVCARPYLYASGTGTAALMGHETIRVRAEAVLRDDTVFRLVCTARGAAHSFSR